MSTEPRSETTRKILRVVGVLSMGIALVLITISFVDFFTVGDGFDDQPTKMWMFFVALPFFLVGGGCLQAGFVGAASRYTVGQTSPAVREFGSAFRGDSPEPRRRTDADGTFCSECGVRNDRGARFCDSCGHAIGA